MGAVQSARARRAKPIFVIQAFSWGLQVQFFTGEQIELTAQNGALAFYTTGRYTGRRYGLSPSLKRRSVNASFTPKGAAVMRKIAKAASGKKAVASARKVLPLRPMIFRRVGIDRMPITDGSYMIDSTFLPCETKLTSTVIKEVFRKRVAM